MTPNIRKTDRHLPPRVYWKCGAYRYMVPTYHRERLGKSWMPMGKTVQEMWQEYSRLMARLEHAYGMAVLFDRYQREVIPTKAPRTQKDNLRELKNLRAVFSEMEPGAITVGMAYEYQTIRGRKSKTQANHEIALLRHIFTMAARWGVIPQNPLTNIEKIKVEIRDRVPSADEVRAVKRHADRQTSLWIDLKWQTGLRLADMIKLKVSDITDSGIKIRANKNHKTGLIQMTPDLRNTVDQILDSNAVQGMTLFCDARGRPMKGRTMQAKFLKARKSAMAAGDLLEPFTENDIRSAFATLSEDAGLNATDQLLHKSSNAKQHYVHRKTVLVTPIKAI